MTVYVDDMRAEHVVRGRRMIFCHMIADTSDELHAMAEKIGVAFRWLQCGGTWKEHFDIVQTKRTLAVKAGAIQITEREAVEILIKKRAAAASRNAAARS